jgi:hypothetical protein
MKYPREWEGKPGNWYIASTKEGGKRREFMVSFCIHRPGTPDHGRRVILRPSYEQLLSLSETIRHQLELAEQEAKEGEQ